MIVDPTDVVALGGLAVACVTDIRAQRIPNWLTLAMIVSGIGFNAGLGRLPFALLGLGVAFVVHFGLWTLQVQRGGDAKLMMALGAIGGASLMLESTFWKYVLFIPIGLVLLAFLGKLGNFAAALRWTWDKMRGVPVGDRPPATYVPYAPVIAAGYLVARYTDLVPIFG